MPTVKLEPTLSGPMLGGVAGQLVAFEGKVTQTSPVNLVWATVAPWMLSGRIVLTALTMTTQVLGCADTLLTEQLEAVGSKRGVCAASPTTLYYIVKAIPEHGESPTRSFVPVLYVA